MGFGETRERRNMNINYYKFVFASPPIRIRTGVDNSMYHCRVVLRIDGDACQIYHHMFVIRHCDNGMFGIWCSLVVMVCWNRAARTNLFKSIWSLSLMPYSVPRSQPPQEQSISRRLPWVYRICFKDSFMTWALASCKPSSVRTCTHFRLHWIVRTPWQLPSRNISRWAHMSLAQPWLIK